MEESSRYWVEMGELLAKTGEFISNLLGTEATHPTSGCAAGIILSAAIAMTGDDESKMAELRNPAGVKREILIQSPQRYWVQSCFQFAGARLVPVGDESGCSAEQIEAAIGANNTAIAFPHLHPPGYLFPHREEVVSFHDVSVVWRDAVGEHWETLLT